MKNLALSLVVCGAAASASLAQCNLARFGIPDFDQRRTALPSNGGMYCVPTSAINLMGYVANRGVPETLDGPRNWQLQSNYNFVSARIDTMGDLMDTHPSDGTYGDPALQGLRAYLQARAPGKFTVSYYYGDFAVNPLVAHWSLGHLVNICYGFYPVNSQGRYSRNGGHCVTLNGIFDFCDPTYSLRWRDPATDNDNLTTQSTFASKISDASSQLFLDTDGDLHSRIRLWDLGVDSTTRRYLDCIIAVNPLVALTSGISLSDRLVAHRPVQVFGLTPESNDSPIPGNDPITQIALDPQQLEAFIVTSQIIPRQQKVWRHNLATGETVELLESNSTFRITTSRHGELFVYGDGSVRKFLPTERGLDLLQEVDAPATLRALTYDDARDELVALSDEHIIRFPRNLNTPSIALLLPAGVQADGSVSIAIDEGLQRYYIAGTGNPTIFGIGFVPGAPRLRIETSFALPGVTAPDEIQFTDEGSLVLISNGAIAEFVSSDIAGWLPRQGSALAGLPAERALAIGRSRSNFIPGVHDTPAWNNVIIDENVPEVPDCDADFNSDGVLNSQDFFDYLTAFFNSNPAADFNGNGVLNSQDFFDYLTAFFHGCN